MKLLKHCALLMLLALTVCVQAQPAAPKHKRIFITLDVSSSMKGNKYVMANYTAQLISVFCDDKDKVIVYYLGKKHELSKGDGYKQLHISFSKLPNITKTYHEISDIMNLISDYHSDKNYQDWLFVIGDGDWNWKNAQKDYITTTKKFNKFVNDNDIRVCYLQTGNKLSEEYAFTKYLDSISNTKIEMAKSDTTAASVLGNCVYYANRILGFSNSNININKEGDECVSFSSEFPLNRFIVLYQSDALKKEEISVESVSYGNKTITPKLKGKPTTKPLVDKGSCLSGAVWEMTSAQTIPAEETMTICFNQSVDTKHLAVYPDVDVVIGMRPWGPKMDTLNEAKKGVFEICKKAKEAILVVNITDSQGQKLKPELMKKMKVGLQVGANGLKPTFNDADTTFTATIPMTDDEISYYLEAECPGYFVRFSEMQTLRKSDNCPADPVSLITLPEQTFEKVTFKDLMGGKSFGGVVDDSLFQIVASSGGFDVTEVYDGGLMTMKEAALTQNGTTLTFNQTPQGNWCECAFPDELHYKVTLKSEKGIVVGDKSYEGFIVPVKVPVDKRPWLLRCINYLVATIGLLLFLLYLLALMKKKRFKKDARIKYTYMELRGSVRKESEEQSGFRLRKKGFVAWANRWLVPFVTERRAISFNIPPAGTITFVADKSRDRVNLTTGSFDPSTMEMGDYDPEDNAYGSKRGLIEMTDSIRVSENKRYEGQLIFEPGSKNDERGYRILLVILILADLLSIVMLGSIMVKGWL